MKENNKERKQKKVILTMLSALIVLGAIATVVLVQRFKKIEILEEINKAGIEWYKESGETFTIKTVDELYDLAFLSDFYDFKGQTIKLGADLVINEGNASDWEQTPPERQWFPIQGFAGTFDGQGHTISGVYGNGSSSAMGLFSDTHSKCKIKDFKLVNSYFYGNGYKGVGSISSNGSGKFEKIYSDAIVVGDSAYYIGGFIGRVDSGRENAIISRTSQITDCWFDGTVRMTNYRCRQAGGFIGTISTGAMKVEHCLSSGEIILPEKAESYHVGGFCGAVGDNKKTGAKATLYINDSLHVGEINSPKTNTVGTIVGHVLAKAAMTVEGSYSIKNELDTIQLVSGSADGTILTMKENLFIGQEAYRWTTLDFNKHWSAIQDKTPELTCFATSNPINLEGVAKGYNIDWYRDDIAEFELNTLEELYGLQMLCNQKITFAGKTIKLGSDIVMNEGKATDWAKGENLPQLEWIPIGGGGNKYIPFAGTFDGQGHTISGLYMKSDDTYMGLFGVLDKEGYATIKNLRLVNSYLECTNETAFQSQVEGLGSIAGQGAGLIDTVYSDAIVVSKRNNAGGLVGNHRQPKSTLTVRNSWFDGDVTGVQLIGGIIGYVHGDIDVCKMEDCLVTANLTSTLEEGSSYIGGLAGRMTSCDITSCVVSGKLTGASDVRGFIGVVGSQKHQTFKIQKCYNVTNAKEMFMGGTGPQLSLMLKNVSVDEIKGTNGYVNTLLKFYGTNKNNDGRWVAVKDKVPQLKSFTSTKTASVKGLKRNVIDVDISWYNESKKTYTIKTKEQLYGLAELCNSKITFEGKTIKLANDIQINEGKATDWANGVVPTYNWTPIGGGVISMDYMPFSGTFDGQGHTISGVYMKSAGQYLGLFGVTDQNGNATIKNLKVTNSYFESTRTDNHVGQIDGTGSIVGRGTGTFENIYSDAIVYSRFQNTGGLIGTHRMGPLDMTNCWFDGKVTGTILVGGLLGYAHGDVSHTNMTDCLVTAEVASTNTSGDAYVGGLSGRLTCGKIDSCVVQGTLTGPGAVRAFFGLFGSKVDQTIELTKLYNTTSTKSWYFGGLGTLTTSELKDISEDNLKGTKAYTHTLLSFYDRNANTSGRWALIEDATPELKSFTDKQYKKDLSALSSAARPAISDTSWYDESKTTFTINTANELYGLATLCNAKNNFAGKTIKLGADITLNNGKASDWAKGEVPANIWTPIGGGASSMDYIPFSGTFDGQGHTISGVYFKSSGQYLGLFGVTPDDGSATIKNLKVTNSYYESTKTTEHAGQIDGIGGIIGRGNGTLDTIYCDAIIVSKTQNVGGMIGVHRFGPLDITNCWFDGEATGRRIIGGMVGFGHGAVTYTNMTDCLVTADLTSIMTSGDAYIGGLAGYMTNGKIDSCIVQGTFTGPSAVRGFFGGFGSNKNQTIELTKLYNATSTTSWYAGGLGTLTTSELKDISEDNLKGTKAYTHTLLSFYDKNDNASGRWALIEDATPELKSFTDKQYKKDLSALSSMARPALSDTSWYDASKTTFTINTANELYGLATLCNAGNTFAGKTIKLGADITLNNGKASDWAEGEVPSNVWIPIGGGASSMDYKPFSGTFDGQGHTISGVYFKSSGQYLGLFGVTPDDGSATIKNLKVTNSYYESTKTTEHSGQIDGIGGIIGRGNGTLDTIYCDAIIVSQTRSVGGMIGVHRFGPLDMTNCWFAGKATGRQIIGGMVGFGHGNVTYTNMTDCLVTADLTSIMTSGDAYIGGLAGYMTNGKIDSCIIQGTFTGPAAVRGFFGGFGSNASQTIELNKLYNTTSTTSWYAGGLGTLKTSELKDISEDNLKGTKGYTHTLLSFYDKNTNATGRWVVVENGTPELKSFTKKTYMDDLSSLSSMVRPVITDTSWYDESKTTFTISTAGELYGLATLCNAGNTFAGKTIKLGADIKLNSGKASDWAKGEVPSNVWIPIGGGASSMDYKPFSGTFDGQGHTISGVYFKSSGQFLGLFGVTPDDGSATIKNLKVTNSYYESTKTSEHEGQIDGIGGIIGRGNGTLDTIYCDAIIVSKTQSVGGMIGVHRFGPLDITNCWFDGQATGRRIIGGMVGFGHGNVSYTNMTDCLVTAELTSIMTSGDAYIGGLAGYMTNGKIDSCIIQGTFTGPAAVRGFFGGFGSNASQTIELSKLYNTTSTTSWYAGGLGTLNTSELKDISEDKLKGTKGYTNTLLSFYDKNANATGRWVVVEDGTPELKSFTKETYMDDLSGLSRYQRRR